MAALVALASALVFVLIYLVMVRTAVGQSLDVQVFRLLFGLVPGGWPADLVTAFARAAAVLALAVTAVVLGIAALGRRAWRTLTVAVLTVAISTTAGPFLRDDVLERPRFTEEPFPLNGLPSTHATAAAALAVAVVLLSPTPRPWWLTNAAAVVLVLVALGNIVGQAHRPSDVAASFALVASVSAGVLALVGTPRPRH